MSKPIVGKIKVKNDEVIRIETDEKELIFVESLPSLKEAKAGDLISCHLKILKDKDTEDDIIHKFARHPFITTELGSEKVIIETFIKIYSYWNKDHRRYTLSVPVGKLKTLYNKLLKIAIGNVIGNTICESVSQFLTLKAREAWGGDRKLTCGNLQSQISLEEFGYKEIVKLLTGWYRKHDRRLLLLLGITYDQMDEFYEYPGTVYEKITTNPYSVAALPQESAREITKIVGKNYSHEDKLIGLFMRELRNSTIEMGDVCVKAEKFFKENDDYNLRETILSTGDVVLEKEKLYLKEVHQIEAGIANYLIDLVKADPLPSPTNFELLDQPDEEGHFLDEEQKKALLSGLTNNVSIITGQAGTGKTSCVKTLIRILQANNTKFVCASFTGKAASRMEECTGVAASTIHMMLAVPENYDFVHLIWDEFSMTEMYLFYRLIKAFTNRIRITLIGDPNQLPAIGWGDIFNELINSECIPIVKLRTIHRVITKEGELDRIIENSKRIIYWKASTLFDFVEGNNFKVIDGSLPIVLKLLLQFRREKKNLSDFVIITPWRSGFKHPDGKRSVPPMDKINRMAQVIFNSTKGYVVFQDGDWKKRKGYTLTNETDCTTPKKCFHIGDKVIMRHNNYEIKIMNGCEGVVTDLDEENLTVDFGRERIFKIPLARKGKIVNIPNNDDQPDGGRYDTSDLDLAFCLTAHQSQGSQWNDVVLFVDPERRIEGCSFFVKPMLYTIITRACRSVTVISLNNAAAKAVQNLPRKTKQMLSERLADKLPKDYPLLTDDQMEKEIAARIAANIAESQGRYGGYMDFDSEGDYSDYSEEED